MTQHKVLLIRGGAIGDFVLTLPVLAALREHWPQTRLEVLGCSHIAQLAVAGGLAAAVRSIEAPSLAGFFAPKGSLEQGWKDYFGSFAVILSYLYDPEGTFQENVARCSRGQFMAGPHRPDERAGLHATACFLRPLERLAIFDADPVPRLPLSAPRDPGKLLAAHPGSGGEKKNWPETKWSELLAEILRTTDRNLLLVGGEAERGRVERLADALPRERVQLANSLPLPELARRLAGCDAFIGHDSGISHLAASVGLPSLLLWGETPEAVWRPLGQRIEILRAGTALTALAVALVLAKLKPLLGCSS